MNKIKIKLLNYLVKNLLKTITEDDLLKINEVNKTVSVAREKMPDKAIATLRNNAIDLSVMPLWDYIKKDITYHANKFMFRTSIYDENQSKQLVFGKAMLYNLDIIEKKIDQLKRTKS